MFGFIGENGGISLDVALNKNADTANPVYQSLKNISSIHFVQEDDSLLKEELEKGNITAIINIKKNTTVKPGLYN